MPAVANFPATKRFRDFDLAFKPHPVTGDLRVVEDAAAVKRAVKQLVLTEYHGYPYEPSIGSRVARLLFENIDFTLEIDLKESIYEVLNNYEPRIDIVDIFTSFENSRNGVNITVTFNILNIGTDSVNLFLERVR